MKIKIKGFCICTKTKIYLFYKFCVKRKKYKTKMKYHIGLKIQSDKYEMWWRIVI